MSDCKPKPIQKACEQKPAPKADCQPKPVQKAACQSSGSKAASSAICQKAPVKAAHSVWHPVVQICKSFCVPVIAICCGTYYGHHHGWGHHHHHDDDDGHHQPGPTPTPTPTPTSTSPAPKPTPSTTQIPGACYVDRFQQPDAPHTYSLDLLFVVDTSSSMSDNREEVAQGLDDFVRQIPTNVDYQVGVMLAHGSNSPWTGRLYSYSVFVPKVLSSQKLSQNQIRQDLSYTFQHLEGDIDSEGEEGMYSLTQGLQGSALAESQNLGFFRPDAALAVIFISDENDVCSVIPASQKDPKYIPHGHEPIDRARDCKNITAQGLVDQLKALKDQRPMVVSGVVHNDFATINAQDQDDKYGYGYLDVIQLAGGFSIDIGKPGTYGDGLAQLGNIVAQRLALKDTFTLTHTGFDTTTLKVAVDGKSTSFDYLANLNQIHLTGDLGQFKSVVEADYCDKPQIVPVPSPTPSPTVTQPAPSPSPSVTVTPSPSPSPTVTQTPDPTPSPTVTQTPSPTPSPTVTQTPDPTPSPTVTQTPSPTPSPTVTQTPDPTPSPTVTQTPDPTPSPTVTQTPSPTPSPTVTQTPDPTPSPTTTPSPTPTSLPPVLGV